MKRAVIVGMVFFAIISGAGGYLFAQGKSSITFGLSGNPDTLDPQKTAGTLTFQVVKSLYDTLVEPDTTGKLVPALAESWTVSPDGLTWTFKLRQGVVFHNGQPLTSRDVKATLDRIRDPSFASPRRNEFTAIKEVRTPDPQTAVIVLGAPYAPILANLASGWGAILPADLIQSGHNFDSEPIGTGPFKFEKWIRDNKISMVRNEKYWMKGLPKLARVDFQIVPEDPFRYKD